MMSPIWNLLADAAQADPPRRVRIWLGSSAQPIVGVPLLPIAREAVRLDIGMVVSIRHIAAAALDEPAEEPF